MYRRIVFFILTFFMHVSAMAENYNPGSLDWVKEKLKLYTELSWLIQPNDKYSQGISHGNNQSWSKEISSTHSIEFEKTVTSLLCLELILNGSKESYKRFISTQKENILGYTSFIKLHKFALNIIKANPILSKQLLEKNIIIRDMGKSEVVRNIVKDKCSIVEPDPHFFIRKVLNNCTNIFPSYANLNQEQRKAILETDIFHFGHISHLEGGPEMLTPLKTAKLDKSMLDFKLLTDVIEIAGCLGHINNNGSLLFTQKIFKITWTIIDVLRTLGDKDETQILKEYIKLRAKWLVFNHNIKEDVVLTKIGAMMQLTSEQEGETIKKAFNNLNNDDRELILDQLNPLIYRYEKTPAYMPNFLRNFYQKQVTYLGSEKALEEVVDTAIPFLARVIKCHRNIISGVAIEKQPVLSFNITAKQIQEGFEISSNTKFNIQNGIVSLRY